MAATRQELPVRQSRGLKLEEAEHRRHMFAAAVRLTAISETDWLPGIVHAWWPAIEVLVVTGVTNARTGPGNTSITQNNRSGPRLLQPPATVGDQRTPTQPTA